jgi:PelA/Pel-15E family pectate lyase
MNIRLSAVALCVAALFAVPASAAVVGKSAPPPSLTLARIQALPAAEQQPWLDYLKRSEAQRAADKAALAAERAKLTGPVPPPPPEQAHDKGMALDKDAAWYASAEARHVADVIVSFQTPAGGWGKNQSRTGDLRLPGQAYVPNNISHYLAPGDFDAPREPDWNYVGTLDNDATTTELRFLERVQMQVPGKDGDAYRASFVKGVRYLLNAQYPNGGWPQVWPLEGGYHDAITYNDNAVGEAAAVLHAVAENKNGDYAFVPAALRAQASSAAAHAIDIILKTQIVDRGVRTIWGQQHDMLTLAPVAARNFEPALPSTEESADLLVYLMELPDPSPALQASIHAGIAWLQKAAINGYAWTTGGEISGRHLEAKPGAGPIWARYYTPDLQPRFGDRDQTIHDAVNEITLERRNGYSWYNTSPKTALKAYASWAKRYPAK